MKRQTCPLFNRVLDELRGHLGYTPQPKPIVASQEEVDDLAAYFDSRQVVWGRSGYPRRPLTLHGVPVVKANGEPWIVEERIGQGVMPITVIT